MTFIYLFSYIFKLESNFHSLQYFLCMSSQLTVGPTTIIKVTKATLTEIILTCGSCSDRTHEALTNYFLVGIDERFGKLFEGIPLLVLYVLLGAEESTASVEKTLLSRFPYQILPPLPSLTSLLPCF